MKMSQLLQTFAVVSALAVACPAAADVKAGVDAWGKGDYATAVREWREPAAQGDADAQFNMAQAYRLGRGVERDQKQAEILYAKAAAQGHLKAADNYGLLLFQDGRRAEAMPYVQAASDRGDPRAQYLLGIAHFNGDIVAKDWVRAYALLTLSNAAGLPQAAPALAQMDEYIPLSDRQRAQSLAQQLKQESDASRAQQLAAADLATGGGPAITASELPEPAPPAPPIAQQAEAAKPTPSVVAAQAAIAEASRVTGTQSPATAGADFARAAPVAAADRRETQNRPATAKPTPPPAGPPPVSDGPWRVQLGAFSVDGSAERLWRELTRLPALAGKQMLTVPAGRLTKLLAAGFATRAQAQQACNALQASGHDCLVTR
jgi:TPR repeat protein